MNPQFPIYIPSKGRYKNPITARQLDWMGVPYYIIVEEFEYEKYSKEINKKHILVLDKSFQDSYNTCDDLGNTIGKGAGPARNFAWEHAISIGATHHWQIDDDMYTFFRVNNNTKYRVKSGAYFRAMEDFVLRYDNVALAGPMDEKFAKRKDKLPPLVLNTRIYSCNLIRNDIPYRWRARWNDDTDLSLRVLKDGWCTIEFVAFQWHTAPTLSLSGGMTDELYQDGCKRKSEMLVKLHPDVARLSHKFNREHHYVDYRKFQENNKLCLKKDIIIPEKNNEYGMKLISILDTK